MFIPAPKIPNLLENLNMTVAFTERYSNALIGWFLI